MVFACKSHHPVDILHANTLATAVPCSTDFMVLTSPKHIHGLNSKLTTWFYQLHNYHHKANQQNDYMLSPFLSPSHVVIL